MSPVTVTSLHLTIGLLCVLSTCRIIFASASINSHSSSVHGLPCVRRLNQLYCPTAGKNYPSIHKPQATFDSSTVIFHSELFLDQVTLDPSSDEDAFGDRANFTHAVHKVAREKRQVHRFLIDSYIDENKAIIKRMFGEYTPPDSSARETFATYDGSSVMQQGKSSSSDDSSSTSSSSSFHHNDASVNYDENNNNNNYNNANYINKVKRVKRSFSSKFNDHNKIDTCESAVEIVTPYWASNSAGKIRAIVNTQHLQQAIQQEVCQSVQTKRCKDDCTCEQKYKWHRLLAYDPDDDCKGIFMDWFLFPSCCVCRCTNPLIG